MAVKRFLLNTSELNDATYGLDGPSAFILNTSTLDGANVLDGGQFITVATGTASLGAISATVSATVTESATLSASLGGLVGSASATVTESATLSATLGGLVGSASATVTEFATLSATLGGLVGSAISAVAQNAVLSADLGGLVATANSIPTPPEPTPTGGRQYAAPRRKKIQPIIEPVVQIPVIQPKRRYAVASTTLNGMKTQAVGTITFSILEDDAEVLLLV